MNSNLTGRLALVRVSILLLVLVCYCKGSHPTWTKISLHALADVANIGEATQVLKQAKVSEVHFFKII